jgi:D-2-hydroxyacid dehydrogenase (NADP+)
MRMLILHAQSAELAAALAHSCSAHDYVPVAPDQPWPEAAYGADAVVALARQLPDAAVARMPRLRWIQALTTGTDGFLALQSLPRGVHITSARGIHGPAVSEMVFLQMLSLAREFPALLQQQREGRWQRRRQVLLHGKTAVIVGTGVIAAALAARCQVFGMRTVGISATRRPLAHFDTVLGRTALQEAAAEADYLIALVPLDPSTRGLVSAQVLQALRPHAFFINVARGGVCDEDALLQQLERGALAGAALDVFATEPLPPGHPLWKAPRLLITPHLGGESENYLELVQPIIEHNLRCMEEGRPTEMWNLVAQPDVAPGPGSAA